MNKTDDKCFVMAKTCIPIDQMSNNKKEKQDLLLVLSLL